MMPKRKSRPRQGSKTGSTSANAPTERAPTSAVVVLKVEPGRQATSGGDTQALAERVLERVGQQVGEASNRVTVFKNIGSMAVEASPKFLEALAKDPAVRSCRPNLAGTDLLIRPVSGKIVKLDDVDG